MNALVDNDILLKGACYRLLNHIININSDTCKVGYLAAAKFILPKKLRRTRLRSNTGGAETHLMAFIAQHQAIETTTEEQQFAASLEAEAQNSGVNLDTGESQLLAVLILRRLSILATGDKRAIVAIEQLLDTGPHLTEAIGRVTCLEQLVKYALSRHDVAIIQATICNEPEVDKALTICFGCANPDRSISSIIEALDSYILDLRRQAKRVLST